MLVYSPELEPLKIFLKKYQKEKIRDFRISLQNFYCFNKETEILINVKSFMEKELKLLYIKIMFQSEIMDVEFL